jgi:hypothetical protein
MWPFNRGPKPDDLAEILVKEMVNMSMTPGDWKKGSKEVNSYMQSCITHECGNSITRYGRLVSRDGETIQLSVGQEARLKKCYNEIVTTWALSSCIKKN